jgi:hypothetical protein
MWLLNIAILCLSDQHFETFFTKLYSLFLYFFILQADDQVQYNQQSGVRQPNKSPSRWVFQLCIICMFQGNLHIVWYHTKEYEDP